MQTTTDPGSHKMDSLQRSPTLRLVYSAGSVIPWTNQVRVLRSGQKTWIGREVTAWEDIPLPADMFASQRHAAVQVAEDPTAKGGLRLWLTDAGSKNKTFVNGQPITECELQEDDVIRIGSSFFIVRYALPVPPTSKLFMDDDLLGGASPVIEAVRRKIQECARTSNTVLITGESGAGKDPAAQLLHKLSGRSGKFVPINCAAIPEALAEGELFGHAAGSFTGATRDRNGRFHDAKDGTLFLDEIGEMSLTVQAKLLRVLQDRKIIPVGTSVGQVVDVRIIAATNRDLIAESQKGKFRHDLYERLNGVQLTMPPLRSRREDILALLQRFLGCEQPLQPTPAAAEALLLYHWPGNVRELEKMGTALGSTLSAGTPLDVPMFIDRLRLPPSATTSETGRQRMMTSSSAPTSPERVKLTPESLVRLMAEAGGNISLVGRLTRRSPRQIRRLIEQWGLTR